MARKKTTRRKTTTRRGAATTNKPKRTAAAVRAEIEKQQKAMSQGGGFLLDNKNWNRKKVRMLPVFDRAPGAQYIAFFSESQNKGTTSPACWGLPDPLGDFIEMTYRTGTKAERDQLNAEVNRQEEYWIPVVLPGDLGTPTAPHVRGWRCKKSIYQKIIEHMLDDDGDDLSDADTGRDLIVRKVGSDRSTRWQMDTRNSSPLADDQDMYDALIEVAKDFNIKDKFFQFDLEVYETLYSLLTEQELDEELREQLEELDAGPPVEDGGDEDEAEYEDDSSNDVDEDDEGEESTDIEVGDWVSFPTDDGDVEAEVIEVSDDGTLSCVEEDGDPEEPWEIASSACTLLDVEDDPEEGDEEEEDDVEYEDDSGEGEEGDEDEPEEAAPAVKKASRKKTASKKTTAKPAASKKAASKRTTKKTTKKAGRKPPRKPASSRIRNKRK